MKIWKKRMANLLMISVVASFTLMGCGKSGDKKEIEGIADEAAPIATTWSENTTPVDLKLYLDASWCAMDIWGSEHASQTVTQETGVNLVIEKPAADDSQKVNLLIASDDLPDIIIMDKNNPAWGQMIENDQLYNLNELINKYAQGLNKTMDPAIMENNKYVDGNVYRIPNFIETPTFKEKAAENNGLIGTNQSSFLIRQDYLQEIGNPEIKTPQDLTKALEEMAASHPDKIPFYAADGSWKTNNPNSLFPFFGIAPYYVEGTTVKHHMEDPKFHEMYMWMNDLATKGLLTKETFVDDSEVAQGKFAQGLPIVYRWTLGDMGKVPADNPNTTYEPMRPWDTYKQVRTGTGWFAIGIPKKSSNPDRAIQLLEYVNSEPGYKALCYGIEGDTYLGDVKAGPHYKMEDGKPTYHAEYIADKQKDWNGVEQQTGLGPHQMLVFDKTYGDLPTWTADNTRMVEMNEVFGPKVVYEPKLDIIIPATSEEFVIKTKIEELIKEYAVKIVFAATPELAQQEFDTLLQKSNEAGKEKLEVFLTAEYNK